MSDNIDNTKGDTTAPSPTPAAPKKSPGRTKGTGTNPGRLLRVFLTPRQDKMFVQVRNIGMSESEFTRRAIDDLFDKMITRGELVEISRVASDPESTEKK